jgi:hypothetical protein
MKRVYSAFLCLYPREYRDLFGPEVVNVFAQAAQEQRARGRSAWVWFLVTELAGAVFSAAGHWIDRWSAGRDAAGPVHAGATRNTSLSTLQEAQNRVESNLKRMTYAIAHHDFAGARACYFDDLKAREDLRRLRDGFGFEDD